MPRCAQTRHLRVPGSLHADADSKRNLNTFSPLDLDQTVTIRVLIQAILQSTLSPPFDPIKNRFPFVSSPSPFVLNPSLNSQVPERLKMATAPPTANLRGSFFSSRSPSSHSLPFFSISSLPHTFPFKNLNSSLFFVSHSPLFPSQTHRVSTAPVEQAPASDFGFDEEITRLKDILSQLRGAKSLKEKIRVLDSDYKVREFFGDGNDRMMSKLEPFEVFLLKCLVVADQGHVLGFEFDWGRRVEAKDDLRKAFHALGNMIEKWSLHNGGEDQTEVVDMAEMEMLNKLLKLLGEMEQFYNCIGGIIGWHI